jgi:hypothetical protein
LERTDSTISATGHGEIQVINLDNFSVANILDISGEFLFITSAQVHICGEYPRLISSGDFTETNSFSASHLRKFQDRNQISFVPGSIGLEFLLQSGALLLNRTESGFQAIVTSVEIQFRKPIQLGVAKAVTECSKFLNEYRMVKSDLYQGSVPLIRMLATYKMIEGT